MTFFRQIPDHAVAVWTLLAMCTCDTVLLSLWPDGCQSVHLQSVGQGRRFSQAEEVGGKGQSGLRCLIFPKSIMDTLIM